MDQKLIVRKAEPHDSSIVASLLVQAMDNLAKYFTSDAGNAEEIKLFEIFFLQKGTQYSFENTIVVEMDGNVIGASNGYDGGRLKELRDPFFQYIKSHYNVQFPVSDDETEPGEFYIDCLSVIPQKQGQGIGTMLLKAMIEQGLRLNFEKIGLLVDVNNRDAKRLYIKEGFNKIKNKSFMGGIYEHLQIEISQ